MTTQERLDLYLEAEAKIVGGAQSYQVAGRSLTYADLSEIRKTIRDLQKQLSEETGLRGRARPIRFEGT